MDAHLDTDFSFKVNKLELTTEALLPFFEPDTVHGYCEQGCPNYNAKWSCPPFAPKFNVLANAYSKVTLFLVQMELQEQQRKMDIDEVYLVLNDYIKKNFLILERDGLYLSNYSCDLCEECSAPQKGCLHPDKMRFDLTATGLNMGEICKQLFGFHLEWPKDSLLPQKLSGVCAVLSDIY